MRRRYQSPDLLNRLAWLSRWWTHRFGFWEWSPWLFLPVMSHISDCKTPPQQVSDWPCAVQTRAEKKWQFRHSTFCTLAAHHVGRAHPVSVTTLLTTTILRLSISWASNSSKMGLCSQLLQLVQEVGHLLRKRHRDLETDYSTQGFFFSLAALGRATPPTWVVRDYCLSYTKPCAIIWSSIAFEEYPTRVFTWRRYDYLVKRATTVHTTSTSFVPVKKMCSFNHSWAPTYLLWFTSSYLITI